MPLGRFRRQNVSNIFLRRESSLRVEMDPANSSPVWALEIVTNLLGPALPIALNFIASGE